MRLLAVFPDPPWRGGSGSHMRDLEHLQSLIQLGVRPAVLCFVGADPPPPPPEWLSHRATLLPFVSRPDDVDRGVGASIMRGLKYLCKDSGPRLGMNGRFAYPSNYLYDQVCGLDEIGRAADETGATAVLLRSWFLPYAKALKDRGLLVVMDAHDAQARAAIEIFRTLGWLRRWMSLPMVIATRRMEHRYLRSCDELWVPSDTDAACVRAISPQTRCFLYPNLVPLPVLSPEPEGNSGPANNHESILFVGNMTYPPNAQAAEFLVGRIVPALRRRRPNVITTVVGDGAPESVRRAGRGDPRVVVTGRVPDVSEFYRRADAVVVPVWRGAGTKVKLLEALSYGKAVVTTPKGLDGVAAQNGVHLLLAADLDEFVRSLSSLLADPILRRRLGGMGRKLVRNHYAFGLGPRILANQSLLLGGPRMAEG